MVIYKNLEEIENIIDRLKGFSENQISLIKLIAKHGFTTGHQYNQFQDEMIKMKIKINDLQTIIATQSKPKTK